MKNLHFNIDGPMEISNEDFEIYKGLPRGITRSYNQLYSLWVNRYPTAGLARLCLRDLVRQRRYLDTDLAYYELRIGTSYLTGCHKDVDSGEVFTTTMAARPDLLQELTEELLYALRLIENLDTAQLLATLLALTNPKTREPLLDEPTREKLLPYYQMWRLAGVHGTLLKERADYLLAQLDNPALPDWLRNQFLQEMDAEVNRELKALPSEMSEGICSVFGTISRSRDFPILRQKTLLVAIDSNSKAQRAQAAEFLLNCQELKGHCFLNFEDDVNLMMALAGDPQLMGTAIRIMKSCCQDPVFFETRRNCSKAKQRQLLYWMLGVLTVEVPLTDSQWMMQKLTAALKDTLSDSDA